MAKRVEVFFGCQEYFVSEPTPVWEVSGQDVGDGDDEIYLLLLTLLTVSWFVSMILL